MTFYVENMRGYITKKINFRNSVTFLIGINGSGKTTVLKLLNGLLKPSLKELIEMRLRREPILKGYLLYGFCGRK